MKHLKKFLALICAFCLIFGTLSGCGSQPEETEVYDISNEMTNVDSGVVAENDSFSLTWNSERAAVIITSKKDGSVWSSIPLDYLNSTTVDDFFGMDLINSLLSISVRNDAQFFDYFASTSCIQNGRFSSEKIENGIRVTFYFDEIEAIIGMDIYLEGDSFKTKIDPNNIKVYNENQVITVTPVPFMCSTKNTESGDKDSYVVLPSGSGTLIYTDVRTGSEARTFSADMYGTDLSVGRYDNYTAETPFSMPFYGIKSGSNALCAIIESGAESSGIDTRIGDETVGYSYVAAYYNVVGYEKIYTSLRHRTQYNDKVETSIDPIIIGYYPLAGEDANYTGMAKCYKNYLTEKQGMEKSQDNSLLTVKLIGSYLEDDLFLGIPTQKEVALTSYEEAEQILSELNEIAGGSLVADMYGYGKGGINSVVINGDNKLTGAAGNAKKLNSFIEFTNNSSIKTFFNFDPITYAVSGNGYSVNKDAAVNVIDISANLFQFSRNFGLKMKKTAGGVVKVMVSRSRLAESVADSVETADKYGITGMAFNTLGSYCYSDYLDDDDYAYYYPVKSKMGEQVASIIADTKANSKAVMMDGAFAYAAAVADIVTGCPTASQQMQIFDLDVPLYQIVFQGTKSNSVTAINLASNKRQQFLKAIETGSGLTFSLMANYNNELRKQYMTGLNASLYSDNKELIESYVSESKDYLNSVAGSAIKSHTYLADKVTRTVFENGVSVIVNFGEKDFVSEEYGTVKAENFVTK